MKNVAFAILFAAGLAGVSVPASAEADGPDYYRVVGVAPNDVLNIRAEPSARADRIGSIPHDGDGLRNLGCQGGLTIDQYQNSTPAQREAGRKTRWCNIEYRGTTGWVAGWYLGEGSKP